MRPLVSLWARWRWYALAFAVGALVGTLVGASLAFAAMEHRLNDMEQRLAPRGKVYEHGEPVRR